MKYEAIVIGISSGGLNAMKIMFSLLPENFRTPVIIVQHISPHSENQWIQFLNDKSNLPLKEADEKEKIADQFFKNLENIKKTLLKDAEFILASDPAATQLLEVIAIYPGFLAIFCYRIANFLSKLSVPLFPRMITEYAHRWTAIDQFYALNAFFLKAVIA